MSEPDPRKRRDTGLAMVATWTRGAIGAGVVFCGVLAAGLAHALPGQEVSDRQPAPATSSTPATPAVPRPSRSVTRHQAGDDGRMRPVHRRHHHPRLTPPQAPPSPTPDPTHTTSGGS
jgi:hypothetical protein